MASDMRYLPLLAKEERSNLGVIVSGGYIRVPGTIVPSSLDQILATPRATLEGQQPLYAGWSMTRRNVIASALRCWRPVAALSLAA